MGQIIACHGKCELSERSSQSRLRQAWWSWGPGICPPPTLDGAHGQQALLAAMGKGVEGLRGVGEGRYHDRMASLQVWLRVTEPRHLLSQLKMVHVLEADRGILSVRG